MLGQQLEVNLPWSVVDLAQQLQMQDGDQFLVIGGVTNSGLKVQLELHKVTDQVDDPRLQLFMKSNDFEDEMLESVAANSLRASVQELHGTAYMYEKNEPELQDDPAQLNELASVPELQHSYFVEGEGGDQIPTSSVVPDEGIPEEVPMDTADLPEVHIVGESEFPEEEELVVQIQSKMDTLAQGQVVHLDDLKALESDSHLVSVHEAMNDEGSTEVHELRTDGEVTEIDYEAPSMHIQSQVQELEDVKRISVIHLEDPAESAELEASIPVVKIEGDLDEGKEETYLLQSHELLEEHKEAHVLHIEGDFDGHDGNARLIEIKDMQETAEGTLLQIQNELGDKNETRVVQIIIPAEMSDLVDSGLMESTVSRLNIDESELTEETYVTVEWAGAGEVPEETDGEYIIEYGGDQMVDPDDRAYRRSRRKRRSRYQDDEIAPNMALERPVENQRDLEQLLVDVTLHCCYLCNAKFSRDKPLLSHVRRKHQVVCDELLVRTEVRKAYSCYICGHVTPIKYYMVKHLQRCHNLKVQKAHQGTHPCIICNKNLASFFKLHTHLDRMHKDHPSYKDAIDSGQKHAFQRQLEKSSRWGQRLDCPVCGESFMAIHIYKHMKMQHSGDGELDDKIRSVKALIHSGMVERRQSAPREPCPHCNKIILFKNMKRHAKSCVALMDEPDDKKKKYPTTLCSNCGMVLLRKNLAIHMRRRCGRNGKAKRQPNLTAPVFIPMAKATRKGLRSQLADAEEPEGEQEEEGEGEGAVVRIKTEPDQDSIAGRIRVKREKS